MGAQPHLTSSTCHLAVACTPPWTPLRQAPGRSARMALKQVCGPSWPECLGAARRELAAILSQ